MTWAKSFLELPDIPNKFSFPLGVQKKNMDSVAVVKAIWDHQETFA